MDYRAFTDGMRAWVAQNAGIGIDDVTLAGDPIGVVGPVRASLRVLRNGSGVGTDEVRPTLQTDPTKDARVRVVGNRVLTLSIQIRTRGELAADGGAYQYAELLRNALALPSTHDTFDSLGVGFIDVAALQDLGRVFDNREEAGALLDIRLSGAVDWLSSETMGRIEHVQVQGTVNGSIPSAARTIPPTP